MAGPCGKICFASKVFVARGVHLGKTFLCGGEKLAKRERAAVEKRLRNLITKRVLDANTRKESEYCPTGCECLPPPCNKLDFPDDDGDKKDSAPRAYNKAISFESDWIQVEHPDEFALDSKRNIALIATGILADIKFTFVTGVCCHKEELPRII